MSSGSGGGQQPDPANAKGKRAGAKAGAGRRVKPVKVVGGRDWPQIVLFTVVGLLAAGVIGWAAWAVFRPGAPDFNWQQRAAQIDGIVNFRESTDLPAGHSWDRQTYPQNPPVGGVHSYVWQQCMGNVYDAPIADEHAVHSLEHGAVWLTYRQDLPADQVAELAAKLSGRDYMLMSPVAGLDPAVSLQAWGYQLKVGDVTDPRIDAFITALRRNATMEPGAPCSGGNTATGTTPLTQQQAVSGGLGG